MASHDKRQPILIMPLPKGFETLYEPRRDPFYGMERNPYTGKVDDCRDRD